MAQADLLPRTLECENEAMQDPKPGDGAAHMGWAFLYQLIQSRQSSTGTATDQPDPDNTALRLSNDFRLGQADR